MRLAAASMALVLAAALPATAQARLPCAAIVDDQRGLVETTTGEPWRDLGSAVLGSDSRNVTVVLQLAALPATPSRPEHVLVDYTMRFTVGDATAFLTAPAHAQTAASYGVELGFRPVVLGQAKVVRDRKRQQLRVTAPLAAFAPLADLAPGMTATNLNAHVSITPGVGTSPAAARAQTIVIDGASGKATHRLGTRSCVPVGR